MKKRISVFVSAVLAVAVAACVMTGCSKSTENAKKIRSVDDLKGAVIGVQLGTTGDIYASDVEKAEVSRFNKGSDAVVALTQGKVDCVVIDSEPAKEFVKANEGLKILDEPFTEEEYAICLSKDKKDLTKKMNTALEELKTDGTLDKIKENFTGDNQGKSAYKTPDGTKYPNGELHMATNPEFPPYEYVEGKDIVGIDPMAAQAICDKLGYKLVIDSMDFDSIITAVQTGKADFGMAGMTVTDERLESVDFTSSYATSKQVIIVKE